MSKKNNLAKRKKQHEFDLQREKTEKQKKEQKLHAKRNSMKVDGAANKKKVRRGFKVGKKKVKVMRDSTDADRAKIAQAMELDK